jgi:predicted small secreted protein
MKKFNLLMALMMVFALSFAACNDEEQIPPTMVVI